MPAAGSSGGGSGSSASNSSSSCLDPWVLAEGVLLVRAQQLQSQAAAEQQLARVLRYSQQACRQWWQQLHCPGDLNTDSSSYENPKGSKGCRPAEAVRYSQFDCALELLLYVLQQQQLLPAVKPHAASAMQVLLSAAAAAAVAIKAGEGVPMVMKCLNAAKSLMHLVHMRPLHSAAGDGVDQQQLQWLQRLQHQHQQVLQQRQQLLLQHQQQQQQQQQQLQQAGGAGCSQQQQEQQGASACSQQQLYTTGPSREQLLGSLLHLLQQLLLVNDLLHLPDDAFGSCSSDSSSSSDGNGSSSSSSDTDAAAGALEGHPISNEGKERDAPLHAIARALPLLLDLLDPLLLDHVQLAACLKQQQQQQQQKPCGLQQQQHGQQRQQQEHCQQQQHGQLLHGQRQQHGQQLLEQVTWALQVTEAAVRALVAAGITPIQQARSALLAEHQAKHGDSSAPAGTLDSPKLQQLQSRLETLMGDSNITHVLRVLSSRINLLLQLPGVWEGLKSTVQGQQLLQAALSLLMAHKELSLGKVWSLPILLMRLVSRDIRAFLAGTAGRSCLAGSSQQQQQQLPHPQLVVSVLALAALRYKRLHKQLLRLSKERLVRPGGASDEDRIYLPSLLLAGDLAPRSAADVRQAADDAAAAAVAARKEASLGTGGAAAAARAAALQAGAALLAGGGDAGAAGASGGYEEVKDDFSSYSSTVHELLQALSDLSTAQHSTDVAANGSHNLHKQQQQAQQQGEQQQDMQQQDVQQQDQQQQEQPQQLLSPALAMLLQGNALKVLLPALFRAAAELNAAVAAVVPQLQQWRQGAETLQAQHEHARLSAQLSARLNGLHETMAATRKQLEQPGLKAKRRTQLQGLYNQQEIKLSECNKSIEELEQKLLPLPRPVLTQLAKSVHVVGQLLSSLPSRFHCNNCDCTSLSTVSEGFALVRGSSCVCGGCVEGLAGSEAAAREVPAARWVWEQIQRVGGCGLEVFPVLFIAP
jgi:hypothetical protein